MHIGLDSLYRGPHKSYAQCTLSKKEIVMSTCKLSIRMLLLIMTWTFLLLAVSALAQTAPDATTPGPMATTSAEYRFPATVDSDILGGSFTEIWANVYMPNPLPAGTLPLLVFLHGNHATCGSGANPRQDTNCLYTSTGTCPVGFVVTPNHRGYGYLADRLASWSYLVVSINANRGINCRNDGPPGDFALNLARGRLVLKHLQNLSQWNSSGGTPASLGVDLRGKIDFSNVGLMGHSRGGEGVRAAYNLYRDSGSPWPARIPGLNIKAIFEIGPVDGQTSRVLNADGTVWNVLLPMCDGDVSNLQGVRPFDRMMSITSENPAQKSTFTVWGANHNYYNTEWQVSDSFSCTGAGNTPLFLMPVGSPAQRQTGLASVLALFRGNVGAQADPSFNENFNPLVGLPSVVTSVTRVDRGYTDSPALNVTFEDFTQPTGTNTYGAANDAGGITINHGANLVPNHAPALRAAQISWNTPNAFFQTNWTPPSVGADISNFLSLDIRLSRQSSGLNPAGPTNFYIALAQADGNYSSVLPLNAFIDLRGPVGGPSFAGLHPILQTAHIPLIYFNADLTQIRGVLFYFADTPSGAIYVANIRLSLLYGWGNTDTLPSAAGALPLPDVLQGDSHNTLPLEQFYNAVNIIKSIKYVDSSDALEDKAGVEIELISTRAFPVRNELAVLRVGDGEFTLSRYPEDGHTNTLIFTLTTKEFARLANGDPVTVQYGRGLSGGGWDFGPLDKNLLDK
jgi:hypothetical protein